MCERRSTSHRRTPVPPCIDRSPRPHGARARSGRRGELRSQCPPLHPIGGSRSRSSYSTNFRNRSLHDEIWPADPGEPSLQGAIELAHSHEGDSGGTPHAFRLVNRSELSLGAVWNKLRGSARYRPFLHAGWRLPGLPSSAARPAHVSAHLVDGRSDAAQVAERPAVHGTVTVSLGRYLEVAVDLLYHRPSSDEAASPPVAPSRFRLVAERRMRSGELHYIDHPLFGVLMQITPL